MKTLCLDFVFDKKTQGLKCFSFLNIKIKNVIIGNNKFKTFYLQDDIINKLVDIIHKSQDNNKLINEVLITLCSFTKGTQVHKQRLTGQHRLHETLFAYVCLIDSKKPDNLKLIETCCKCLRNLYTPDTSKVSSKSLIDYLYVDLARIQVLFKLFNLSDTCKESIIDLFSNTCYFREYQDLLIDLDAMRLFSCLLMSHSLSTQLSILNFFACITYNNKEACNIVMMDETNICDSIGKCIYDAFSKLWVYFRSGVLWYRNVLQGGKKFRKNTFDNEIASSGDLDVALLYLPQFWAHSTQSAKSQKTDRVLLGYFRKKFRTFGILCWVWDAIFLGFRCVFYLRCGVSSWDTRLSFGLRLWTLVWNSFAVFQRAKLFF